jgi:hypothetical protein
MDIRGEIESWFSSIRGKKFKIIKASGKFNCIAYTLDFYDEKENTLKNWNWKIIHIFTE